VWRSWAADEEQADDLIEETAGEARAAGRRRVLWHTGDLVAPPFMDERLARHGFRKNEDLKVLAFVLVNGQEQQLPRMRDPEYLFVEQVRCAGALDEALRVDEEVFGSPPPTGGEFAEHAGELEELRRRERGGRTDDGASVAMRFVAHMNSPPRCEGESPLCTVAAAGAQIVGETLRLWGAGTRRAFRGRGAYGALVLERCRVGRHLGATLALAKANVATSAPIRERAGFYPVGVERRHVLEI